MEEPIREEKDDEKDGSKKNRENKPENYNEKYKNLISEYKQQILRLDLCPLQLAKRLEDQKVISKMDLQYINSLTLPKWQMEILFEFLLRSRCDQLGQVKAALKHYADDGTDVMFKIFEEITVRGQHILRDACEHGVGSKLPRAEPELPTDTWLPYQLFEAAYEGNVKQLVEVFAHISSLQMFLDLIEGIGKELTGNGVSPLHVACAMGGVKADFVHCFLQLIQLLINSETGTLKSPRMLSFKSHENDKCSRRRKEEFVEVRMLEDFLNLRDSWGNSALHWAAKMRATDLAKYLYIKRADLFIENDEGDTPLEILYEISPEVVVCILNDHIPPVMSLTKREREDEEVSLDMISITGCRSRASVDQLEARKPVDTVETQLLAQMVLGNMEESSKQILPHVLVKTFLDEKWKKLVAPIFMLTSIYILFHLLHTIFIVQVFIVAHPYRSTNGTSAEPMTEGEGGKNMSQDFYNYLLGNWDSPDSVFSTEPSTLSKDLAMVSKVTAILMLIAESFEIWATAVCVSHTRDDGLRPRMERKWAARRKIDLVLIIILSSIYERDTWRVFVSIVLLMPLYIYDWVVITSNSRDKNKKRKFSAFVIFKLLKIAICSAVIILSIFPTSGLNSDGPTNVAWLTISVAGACIVMEIFKSAEFVVNKLLEVVSATVSKTYDIFRRHCRRRRSQHSKSDEASTTTPQSFPLMGQTDNGKNDEEIGKVEKAYDDDECHGNDESGRASCRCHVERGLVSFLVTFWRGALAYLTNLENVLQLTYIAIIIFVSDSVHRSTLTKGLYRGAAVSVVLAWILILLQIGHVYGLGKYIHMLRTVVKSFLAVMGIYLSLLVAFSLSFSIVFPNESRFESLPSSFFRVVSMMAGELNYDDIFYPENPQQESNAFPYASQWLHLIFVLGVVIVLINLLIGLTVNDIQKIQEKSDVIYRSVQVERLYIMEIFFKMLSKFLTSMCCCCFWRKTVVKFSAFNVLKESSSKMLIKWSRLSPTLQEEFLQARNQVEEDQEKLKIDDDDRDSMTNLSLQISAVFQDQDQIENLPLHWLFAYSDDRECQQKICSISLKDSLTANECNFNLLTQLSTFSVRLKILRISLEKCAPDCGDDGDKFLSECKKILLTILVKNKETLNRLEIDWNSFPQDSEIPQLPELTSLLLISQHKSDEKVETEVNSVEDSGTDQIVSKFDFHQKFPKLSTIEISGPALLKLDDVNNQLLLSQVFPKEKSLRQIKNLTLSVGESDSSRIQLEVFERLRNLFPRIERLEVGGGLKRMPGGEDVVPQLWTNLKLVVGGAGDTWIKIQGGSEKSSPDTGPWDSDSIAGLFPVPNISEVNDAGPSPFNDPRRRAATSDGSSGGPSRFGSGLAGRLRNFLSKSAAEDEYPLDGNGMGYILIINNLFDDPSQEDNLTYINLERGRGAWDDGVKMDRLFRDLNFRTTMERNVGSQELPEILDDFKSEVIRYDYHSCFVFVMSHGLQQLDGSTSILMDDLVAVDLFKDIVQRLVTVKSDEFDPEAVHFMDVPKAFFVHSCQYFGGGDQNDELSQWSRSSAASISHQLLPGVSNTLVCRSTTTSPVKIGSVRNSRESDGSLFIEAIDRVFRDKAASSSLQEMMALVSMYVQERSAQRQGPTVNYFGFNRQYRFQKSKKA